MVENVRSAWIDINLDKLRGNIDKLKGVVAQDSKIMGVIKADGYGHGAVEVASILREEGIGRFAVAISEEGIELRESGFTEPILIFGNTPEEDYDKIAKYTLTPTIYSLPDARKLDRAARHGGIKIPVHIKIDTGMGRLGFVPDAEALCDIEAISKLENIHIEGIFSHMSSADKEDNEKSLRQYKQFIGFLDTLASRGVSIPIRHIANSAVMLKFPQMHLDLVRAGICMYGIYPSAQMANAPAINLQQMMEVKARLVHVKKVPCSTEIGYGGTFKTDRESVIGTVPLGYADGISAAMSNKAEFLAGGRRRRVVGRICMDQLMIDLTEGPQVRAGDEVVIMGRQGNEMITADEIAGHAGTISYEVVTRMGKRLSRVYAGKR